MCPILSAPLRPSRAPEAAGLKPVIDRSFGLDSLSEAFRYEESGAHFGKICIEF